MFSKECHGNILSMHLAKFHKLEKWHSFCCFVLYKTKQLILLSFLWSSQNIKKYPLRNLKCVNENYKYCSSAIIFQNNWPVYLGHHDLKKKHLKFIRKKKFWICRQLKYLQLRIRSEIFIFLQIILNAFNFWQSLTDHFPFKSLF